jgi:hypothetical protein
VAEEKPIPWILIIIYQQFLCTDSFSQLKDQKVIERESEIPALLNRQVLSLITTDGAVF